VKFEAGELSFIGTITEAGQTRSPQTGATLRTLTVQFRAPKPAMHELALETARRQRPVYSTAEDGEPEAEWRICASDSTYIGTEPWGMHHHVWSLQEVEHVACRALRLGPLELEPYEYGEQLGGDDALVLAARCVVSAELLQAVRDLRFEAQPIEVVRVGISEEPRRMRLDDYVWGPCARGELGVALRCEDVRPPRVGLAGTTVREDTDTLLATLRELAMLDVTDLEKLRQQRHALRHVADLDAWPL
jgi:hypothetical protein